MDGGELSRAVVAEQPMDCCFHPSCNLLAAGVITGQVQVFRYEGDQTTAAFDVKAHNESCRSVRFTQSGELLLSASADCSILATDTATGQPAARLEDAHPDGINRLECIDSATLASGDDEGLVKLWDIRQQKAIATLEAHSDFVSDFFYSQELNSLVATSGDGTISVTDLRRNKVVAQSEDDADDELLSVVVLKNGKKVVSGSQEGVLFLYSWGYWNDCSDRFPGHPNSIDTIVKFDEDTIITGSSDGIVRILNILPNKLLGVVGEHAEMPIERIALSGDRKLLASASHDKTIKVWDIRQQKAIATLEAHSDFVSDFFYSQELNSLVATSGDGTISVTDLRRNKVVAQSEDDADDELLSVVVLKNGKKVVSGSQEGVLFLYSWGYWNDCSDRFPGHPNSIDTIVKFDEDTIITGSSDGIVRILNILPNKLLGVVGEHAEMPIERIALSGDRKLLASASHDKTIKIWDIKFLQEQDGSAKGETEEVDMEEEVEEAEELVAEPPSSDNGKAPAVPDAEEEEEDSDMDDSDDDMKQKNQKPEKTRMKGRGKGKGKANHKSNFFSGML